MFQDPTLGAELSGLSAECKADLILANESRLRESNALFRTFTEKKSCLNSDALQEVPRLEAKLIHVKLLITETFSYKTLKIFFKKFDKK